VNWHRTGLKGGEKLKKAKSISIDPSTASLFVFFIFLVLFCFVLHALATT